MRMRLLVGIILCIAAMLFVNAYAGTDGDIRCWTANADPDYHMDKNCRDAEMFPISEKSAVAFGKKACADCVESEEKTVLNDADGVWMAHRGGTYLLCIPYETVEGTASFKTEESPETRAYTGEEAEKQLAGMVAPTALEDIKKRRDADGWVYDSCRMPELSLGSDVLLMSARCIDEDWYFAIRPDKVYGDQADLRWRIAEWDIQLESYGTLTLTRSRTAEYADTVAIEEHSDAKSVYENQFGSLGMTVYRQQGVNTAVIYNSGWDDAPPVELFIGGVSTSAILEGYVNGQKQSIYCCVLSDAELAGIVAGRMPELKLA